VVASDLEGEGAVQGPATLSYRNAGGIHGAIVRGDTAHHELGRQITSGDLDGDGQRDLVFGAPDAEGSEGRVVGVLAGAYGLDVGDSSAFGADQTTWYLDADFDGQASTIVPPFQACPMHVPMDLTDPAAPVLGAVSDATAVLDCDGVDSNCDGVDGYAGVAPNHPPTTPGIELTGFGGLAADNDLICRVTTGSVDIDGDPVSYAFSWTLPGDEDADGDTVANYLDPRPFTRSQWTHLTDYSPTTNGTDGWHYRWLDGLGGETDLAYGATVHGVDGWTCTACADEAYIVATELHPASDPTSWTSLDWEAPMDGTVRIEAAVYKATLGGDGVRARLELGGSVLYDQVVGSHDDVGYSYDLQVTVDEGDVLRFQLSSIGDAVADGTVYEPRITWLSPGLDTDGDGTDDDVDACPLGDDADLDGNGLPDDCEVVPYDSATDGPTTSTVDAVDVRTGSTWTCEVTPDDGMDTGTAASATVTVP
jgi:hypothetical protein